MKFEKWIDRKDVTVDPFTSFWINEFKGECNECEEKLMGRSFCIKIDKHRKQVTQLQQISLYWKSKNSK